MINAVDTDAGLKLQLARLLKYGTWTASAVIGGGLILALMETNSGATLEGMRIVALGIAGFILLPILRVVLMLIDFARKRDYLFVAIAGTVLLTILAGLATGAHMAKPGPQSTVAGVAAE